MPLFYALLGPFRPGEGFFFCIKDSVLIDPACGVCKFLLEAALKFDEPFTFENGHVVKKIKLYGYEKEMDEKGSTSGYDLTTILAKANTMIYFSSLFKDNNTLSNIKTISQELLNETYFSSKTILGTLGKTDGKQYDEKSIYENKKKSKNGDSYVYKLLKEKDSKYTKTSFNADFYVEHLDVAINNSKYYSAELMSLKDNVGTMIPYFIQKINIE